MINFKKKWISIKSFRKNPNKSHRFKDIFTENGTRFVREVIGKPSGKVIFTVNPYYGK